MQAIFDGGPPPPVPTPFNLAAHVLDVSLDEVLDERRLSIAQRCGVSRTSAVETRTFLLLVRNRFHIRKAFCYQQVCNYVIHVKLLDEVLRCYAKLLDPPFRLLPLGHYVNFPARKVRSQPDILTAAANS